MRVVDASKLNMGSQNSMNGFYMLIEVMIRASNLSQEPPESPTAPTNTLGIFALVNLI